MYPTNALCPSFYPLSSPRVDRCRLERVAAQPLLKKWNGNFRFTASLQLLSANILNTFFKLHTEQAEFLGNLASVLPNSTQFMNRGEEPQTLSFFEVLKSLFHRRGDIPLRPLPLLQNNTQLFEVNVTHSQNKIDPLCRWMKYFRKFSSFSSRKMSSTPLWVLYCLDQTNVWFTCSSERENSSWIDFAQLH